MGRDGRYVAVVDRFEGEQTVLLVERDGDVVDEIVVDRDELPPDGRSADAVFEVRFESGRPREFTYLPGETRERTTDAQARFDRLSQRPPGGQRDSDGETDAPDGHPTESDGNDSSGTQPPDGDGGETADGSETDADSSADEPC